MIIFLMRGSSDTFLVMDDAIIDAEVVAKVEFLQIHESSQLRISFTEQEWSTCWAKQKKDCPVLSRGP